MDGGGLWDGIARIRERLTPGPLTLLSLSPRIEVSHFGLSLSQRILEQVMHKEFWTGFELKSFDYLPFLAKSASICR